LRHALSEQELITTFVRLVDTYEVILLAQRGVETTKSIQKELYRDDRLQGKSKSDVGAM